MSVIWTPATESTLREMAADGNSAAEIAKALGATRNAVIGKARRLKITLRGNESGTMRHERAVRAAKTRWADPANRAEMSETMRLVKAKRRRA